VPRFIKEHKSANLSLKNLLHFCMEDSKNLIASRWQRQPPLKTKFYLSVLQMKSSSTCSINASLYEGPFFYFYVESPPSTFMHCLREHSCHSEYNVHCPIVIIDWFMILVSLVLKLFVSSRPLKLEGVLLMVLVRGEWPARWKSKEEGVMSIAAGFPSVKKPRFIVLGEERQTTEGDAD
jgi:hypothetical protein